LLLLLLLAPLPLQTCAPGWYNMLVLGSPTAAATPTATRVLTNLN
jgi:hypothetical protein